MEVAEKGVLHMNGGEGPTSYAQNCSFQRKILQMAMPAVEAAVLELYGAGDAASRDQLISVADLGCSSGPNALAVVAAVVDAVEERCMQLGRSPPEFQLFLNDLPGNDFNSVFRSLEAFYQEREIRRCFVGGVVGSFYGRLFPTRSIHFFCSSSSLHWLSQVPMKLQQHEVPLNKGSIYISERSPPSVVHAYRMQFRKDFSEFLKCRSEEMVVGGRMVLTLVGRKALDPTRDEAHFHWDILAQLLMGMAQEGYIEEEKVDSFNLPYYAPSAAELESEIQSEGSFSLKCLEIFEARWEACQGTHDYDDHHGELIKKHDGFLDQEKKIMSSRGQSMSNCLRATVESMLESHFGGNMLLHLFSRYSEVLEDRLSRGKHTLPIFVMSLVRKPAETCR